MYIAQARINEFIIEIISYLDIVVFADILNIYINVRRS